MNIPLIVSLAVSSGIVIGSKNLGFNLLLTTLILLFLVVQIVLLAQRLTVTCSIFIAKLI